MCALIQLAEKASLLRQAAYEHGFATASFFPGLFFYFFAFFDSLNQSAQTENSVCAL